jgi:hypothetical protein
MEERPPIWRVAADILVKQSRTADEGWSSMLRITHKARCFLWRQNNPEVAGTCEYGNELSGSIKYEEFVN